MVLIYNCYNYLNMTSITVEDDLLADLKLLKGILRKNNMTEVIRQIMHHAGYQPAFFEKMAELQSKEVKDFLIAELEGDSPD